MNKIIFAASILASAGLGYWAGTNNSTAVAPAPSPVIAAAESPHTSATATTQPISAEKNIHPSDAIPFAGELQVSHPEMSTSDQQQLAAVKTQYEFAQRSEKFTNWLIKNQREKSWFDLGTEMNGRFEAEQIDYTWAAAEEGSLQTLFTQDASLAGIALKSTACKSTQCRISVSVIDHNHANETAMAISNVIGKQIIIDNKINQGEAIFYVSRNEKGFEFN